ncbi:MAG: response regulator transcription factor [Acidobacteria bacterium]|nr:response regulator transcription factor [Acidobacteriota bacterium]
MQTVSVVIADSDGRNCQSLAAALERCSYPLEIVACATQAGEILEAVHAHRPDVALIGESLTDDPGGGYRVAYEIHLSYPSARVVMLLDRCEKGPVVRAFHGGASGVIDRSEPAELIGKCICCVASGQIWARSQDLQFLLESPGRAPRLRLASKREMSLITAREQQIVRLVAKGMSNREVAKALRLCEKTVKNHLTAVFDKLGVSSRTELLYMLLRRAG